MIMVPLVLQTDRQHYRRFFIQLAYFLPCIDAKNWANEINIEYTITYIVD